MEIKAALTHVDNRQVAFVWVSKYAILNNAEAQNYLRDLSARVFRMPVILVATGDGNKPLLFAGEALLTQGLSIALLLAMPWKTYHVN
jgi:hypothetical protein